MLTGWARSKFNFLNWHEFLSPCQTSARTFVSRSRIRSDHGPPWPMRTGRKYDARSVSVRVLPGVDEMRHEKSTSTPRPKQGHPERDRHLTWSMSVHRNQPGLATAWRRTSKFPGAQLRKFDCMQSSPPFENRSMNTRIGAGHGINTGVSSGVPDSIACTLPAGPTKFGCNILYFRSNCLNNQQ